MPTPTVTISNATSIADFTDGLNAVQGQGSLWQLAFGGTWAVGDAFVCQLITPSQTYDFGTGRMTGLVPVNAVTLYNRVHFVAGISWCGSDNGDATAWEQQAPGAFKINVANQSAQLETLQALSPFQGRMAVFSRRTTQVWIIDPNPANITQQQVLSNIGIVSPNAAQSLGDFDVPFPTDSGIRSLRVQTINLNGFISDIGAPVDTLIQAAIQGQTSAQLEGICAVVDPVGDRYIIYFPSVGTYGTFYVFSYFPSSKILAWSTFTPSLSGSINFSLTTMRVFNSVFYMKAKAATALPGGAYSFIGSYGTPDGTATYMYDAIQPIAVLPWLDLKKSGSAKTATEIDYAIQGQWSFYGSMDFDGVNKGGSLQTIASQQNQQQSGVAGSFQTGEIPWTDEGYHVQLKAVGDDATYPGSKSVLSSLVFHYQPGDEK